MKIAITSETSCDLTPELREKYDVKVVPHGVLLGEDTYFDGVITTQEILDFVKKTGVLPRTNAVNEYQYEEFFTEILKDYDAIIHISMGSNISSCYQSAVKTVENMGANNIYVIDTLSLCTGMGLQVMYARELADAGYSPEEIVELVTARVPNVHVSFVVDDLEYLYKGGRCSSAARFIGGLLNIKPQIVLKPSGLVPGKKFMGKIDAVITKLVEQALTDYPNIDKKHVFVSHCVATPSMIQAAIDVLVKHGVPRENILVAPTGATITSHCGPGTLGVLYYCDGGVPIENKN